MIDLPMKAEVHCSDGAVGRSTNVIYKPINRQITHLVVQSNRPPFHKTLVPVDQVEETTSDLIRLKCTRNDLNKMQPFEYEDYIHTKLPSYDVYPYVTPDPMLAPQERETWAPLQKQNIPTDESAVWRGARVEATDGYVGQLDELLIDSNNMQITHLVLRKRHKFENREITIPVSQIDRVYKDKIYLKLDRQSVEELPTTPIQRWPGNKKDWGE